MLVLILHKDVHFLQNAKNLCYCQLIKGQRGSCPCSLGGETSQELTPRAAQYPWYSLARGGRAVGWNSEYQEEPLCFLAQSRYLSSALALPFSAFSACPQGRLDWCGFLLPSCTNPPHLSGARGIYRWVLLPSLDQTVKIHRFTAAGSKDCTFLGLPLLCSSLEPSGSEGPISNIQFQPLHYNS